MLKRMNFKCIKIMFLSFMVLLVGCSAARTEGDTNGFVTEISGKDLPMVTIEVEGMGIIKAELYPTIAPNTVTNFIYLANSGFYNGLTFHRVIDGFMAQGGDPNGTGTGGPGYTIPGEFKENGYEANNLAHVTGVLSMARTQAPDSAGSQFFIMTGDASHLDGKYAAFGKVIEGMDVVMQINSVPTGKDDKPNEPVIIKSIVVDTKGIDYAEPEKSK